MKPARAIGTLALLFSLFVPFAADTAPSDYPAASVTPASRPGWDANPNQFDDSAPPDEAQGGMTEAGTPIAKRTEDFFPAEQRNLFWGVDQVVGPDGGLHPFPYSNGTAVPKDARDAIRGKNTWIAWGEGNEVFWDWVQQHGYGLADFLILAGFAPARHALCEIGADQPARHEGPAREGQEDPRPLPRRG